MKRKAVTRKTATALMERPRPGRPSVEVMVSFADMLRMVDPKVKRIIKIPLHWFPAIYDRKDQAALNDSERERFLCAYLTLIGSGTLGQFVKIHGEIHYHHHTQRFLPWHRVYLFLLEQQLKSIHPDVSIPYWDWTQATEQGFPAWLASVTPTVSMPPPMAAISVTRSPGSSADIATIVSSAPTVLGLGDFTSFTGGLEAIHDSVHVWVGGTMSFIATAPCDPIFWMHHANIDRLWSSWQQAHAGLNPNLSGPPGSPTSSVMDPWSYTEVDTRSIAALGYRYV